jgi:hypothetical protein
MPTGKTFHSDAWIADVEAKIDGFAKDHAKAYSKKRREQSAIFEIGCFLALVDDYLNQRFSISPKNLDEDGGFRYLTSPSGNPKNFSFVTVEKGGDKFDLRQQIRIRSHLDPDVIFTPDLVVVEHGASIEQKIDRDFAGGKRGMFAVAAKSVLAVHECKSLPGFPELYVSFLGMLLTVHFPFAATEGQSRPAKGHLASTLFVGGESSALHIRMILALQRIYPLNIITGLHKGGWVLTKRKKPVNRSAIGRNPTFKISQRTSESSAAQTNVPGGGRLHDRECER